MAKNKKPKTITRYRDAITGQYIPEGTAKRRPKTTVKETDKVKPRKKPKKK